MPPFDIAYGGAGNDAFIWAPGDRSDASVGGDSVATRTVTVTRFVPRQRPPRGGPAQGHPAPRPAHRHADPRHDAAAVGRQHRPNLFSTRFGQLPRTFVSDRNLPATSATRRRPRRSRLLPGPAGAPGLGYDHLLRCFVEATGVQAVTIRIRGVEQVLCGTQNADAITQTTIGRDGAVTDFSPAANSKLDALVD